MCIRDRYERCATAIAASPANFDLNPLMRDHLDVLMDVVKRIQAHKQSICLDLEFLKKEHESLKRKWDSVTAVEVAQHEEWRRSMHAAIERAGGF